MNVCMYVLRTMYLIQIVSNSNRAATDVHKAFFTRQNKGCETQIFYQVHQTKINPRQDIYIIYFTIMLNNHTVPNMFIIVHLIEGK